MAIQKVTYTDKEDLNIDPTVPLINKVIAADMNEIKSVINNNADELENVEAAPEVMIQTTTPTEGKIFINPNEMARGSAFELNKIYPVGSIYINTTGVNPGTFMGGSWEAFGSGRVLVGQDTTQTEFDTLLETGGEKKVAITGQELPPNNIGTTTTGSNVDGYFMLGGYNSTGTYNIGGGGQAHNNLQPYIVVSMWVRVA